MMEREKLQNKSSPVTAGVGGKKGDVDRLLKQITDIFVFLKVPFLESSVDLVFVTLLNRVGDFTGFCVSDRCH